VLDGSSEIGPVAIVRASAAAVVPDLLGALRAGRKYLMAPWELSAAIQSVSRVDEVARNRVFCVDRENFAADTAPNGAAEVEPNSAVATVEGAVAARCSLLWQSPHFAELSVFTEPPFRRRGLARAVLSAMISELLHKKITPLYIADRSNRVSIRLAESLGFARCAGDEFSCYLVD